MCFLAAAADGGGNGGDGSTGGGGHGMMMGLTMTMHTVADFFYLMLIFRSQSIASDSVARIDACSRGLVDKLDRCLATAMFTI